MMSKISFFRLLREDLKGRSWAIVLLLFVSIVLLPVNYQMRIDQYASSYSPLTGQALEQARQAATAEVLGSASGVTMALIIAAAALCAATGFYWLHSRKKVDFYHSLAVKREKMLAVCYLGGVLSALVPYLVSVLIAFFGVGTVNGMVTAETAVLVFRSAGFFCLAFGSIYSLCVLAMLLTGKILTGLLGMGVFCGYGPLCISLIQQMKARFFETYYMAPDAQDLAVYFSPVTLMRSLGGSLQAGRAVSPAIWLAMLLFLAGGLALCLAVCRIRPSESAECAVSFPKLEGVLKAAVCIPGALLMAQIVEVFAGYGSRIWFATSAVLGALLLNGVIEFIFSSDLRNIGRHWRSGAAALGGTVLLLVLFLLDPMGYDRWQPSADQVEAMSLYSYGISDPLVEYYVFREKEEDYFLENGAVREFLPVYELASEGIAKLEQEAAEDYEDSVTLCYFLKNGRKAYRHYVVDSDTLLRTVDELSAQEDFRKCWYPAEWEEFSRAESASVTDWKNFGTSPEAPQLYGEALQELKAFYREESLGMTMEEMRKDIPVCTVVFQGKDRNGMETEVSCYVYPGQGKTLDFLKQKGFLQETGVDVSEIYSLNLEIRPERETETGGPEGETAEGWDATEQSVYYTFYTEEEISRALSCLERCTYAYSRENGGSAIYLTLSCRNGEYREGYCRIVDQESLDELLTGYREG